MTESIRIFVEGGTRGFIVGTRRGATIIKEVYFRDDGTSKGIDRAYTDARRAAMDLEYNIEHNREAMENEGWL